MHRAPAAAAAAPTAGAAPPGGGPGAERGGAGRGAERRGAGSGERGAERSRAELCAPARTQRARQRLPPPRHHVAAGHGAPAGRRRGRRSIPRPRQRDSQLQLRPRPGEAGDGAGRAAGLPRARCPLRVRGAGARGARPRGCSGVPGERGCPGAGWHRRVCGSRRVGELRPRSAGVLAPLLCVFFFSFFL